MVPTDYNDDLQQDFEIETQPSRTYALRFDGYPSAGKLDGVEAMKQAIFLALQIERFRFAIYSWNYGIELDALLGQSMTPYLQAKVAKAIEDALLADDRILLWKISRFLRLNAIFMRHLLFPQLRGT